MCVPRKGFIDDLITESFNSQINDMGTSHVNSFSIVFSFGPALSCFDNFKWSHSFGQKGISRPQLFDNRVRP